MVIDTSAFLAILQDEPDRRSFTEAIGAAVVRRTSAATFLEASPLLGKGDDFARTDLDLVLPPAPQT